MKRILITLLILAVWAGIANAAGTCVQATGSPSYVYAKTSVGSQLAAKVVTLTCTHHTDNSLSVALASTIMDELSGWYVYSMKSIPSGVTAPTDATDFEITDADGLSLVGANGTDFIDATSTQKTLGYNTFLTVNEYLSPVASETWTISTTNNAVASAIFTLKIYLAR